MADTKDKKKVNLHRGHRQRLKDKVRKNFLEVLTEHEILELLLTYTIPLKDTNELAHRLIESYGSINRVLNAPRLELLSYSGIGEESALFLNILSQLHNYLNAKNNLAPIKINTVQEYVDYFDKNLTVGKNESAYLVFTDKKGNFIRIDELNSTSSFDLSVERDRIGKIIALTNAQNVILYHTHPLGNVTPSLDDIEATKKVLSLCKLLGVRLFDHIIVNQSEHFSFHFSGILNELEAEVTEKLGNIFSAKKQDE